MNRQRLLQVATAMVITFVGLAASDLHAEVHPKPNGMEISQIPQYPGRAAIGMSAGQGAGQE